MKYLLYQTMRRLLPPTLQRHLAASSLTRGLRDAFFRPGGDRQVVSGPVRWEDLEFHFTAPYKTLYKARQSGVENRICRLARAALSEGGSGIDVGANFGFITLVMAHCLGPGQKVVAVEIDVEVSRALARSLRRNGLADRVTLVSQGAGATEEGGLVTVDRLVQEHGLESVSLLKIDVDGVDFEVLQGSREVLLRHHPVVVIELNERATETYHLLQSCGYDHFMDTAGRALAFGESTENLVASVGPVTIPDRGRWGP